MWLDAVKERIDAQTGSRGGKSATFKYRPKRKRWAAVAKLFATAAHRDRRPLTWLTQDEIAAVVSCTDRTVRRIVRWLCKEGLLWEVVPGCQLPEQEVPDGETPAEAAGRRARMLAAIAAEESAVARARAELDAVRSGQCGADAAAAAAQLALQGVADDLIDAVSDCRRTRPWSTSPRSMSCAWLSNREPSRRRLAGCSPQAS